MPTNVLVPLSDAARSDSPGGRHQQRKATVLSDLDAVMWREGVDREILTIVTNVIVLERPPDYQRLFDAIERVTHEVPRLKQTIRAARLWELLPRWTDDPTFCLSNHIHIAHLPPNSTDRDFLDLVANILTHAFNPELAMWSVTLVTGLQGGRGALVVKRHHALMDGISLAKLLLRVANLSNEPAPVSATLPREEETPAQRTRDADRASSSSERPEATILADAVRQMAMVCRNFLRIARLVAPAPRGMSSIMRHRSRVRRHFLLIRPVETLRRAAQACDATINDVFLAAVALTMRAYHAYHDAPDRCLRVSLPISTRSDNLSVGSGNQIVLARVRLPLAPGNSSACIRRIHHLILETRERLPHGPGANIDMFLLSRLPSRLAAMVWGGVLKSVDVGTTNVNCSSKSVHVAGARVSTYAAFVELCGAPMNITLYTYAGNAAFGITVDPAAVPDCEFLISCFEEALEAIGQC